ncbi:hypothetical protein QFZ51_003360 [Chitinophaga sp. W3I9]|uniref:hypothetical protein n=1 Tax=unclassified Chitinophaga TaxID=2619133 RepID=UPI003D1B11B0
MVKGYCIIVDMRVQAGYTEYCRFYIGEDRSRARALFDSLHGSIVIESILLRMSLVNLDDTPHEVLVVRYCTLTELTENCRLITKEVFRYFNIE